MIRYLILTTLTVSCTFICNSQADTLNQIDVNGKKTGWCISYLNKNLEILTDSIEAEYCMYNYYRRDIWLFRFGEGYGTKKSPIIPSQNNLLKLGNYTLLNGKYITRYKNGNLRSELIASNGYITSFKHYYKSGQLKFEIIVSKECGYPKQHCLNEYNKDGSLRYQGHTWLPKDK